MTLDGPSGSGKGTIGQLCAKALGWHFLDSGAVYRAVAYVVREKGIDINALDDVLDAARDLDFRCVPAPPDPAEIWIGGRRAPREVRGEGIGKLASKLAAIGPLRSVLLDLQRAARKPPGLVADGRDMGTVVFPDAELKIFLTASVEERAKRRYKQLKLKGFDGSLAGLLEAIRDRDTRDSQRSASPLAAAPDAVTIDSSHLAIGEVVARILALIDNPPAVEGIELNGQ